MTKKMRPTSKEIKPQINTKQQLPSWFRTTESWLYKYKTWLAELQAWEVEQAAKYEDVPPITMRLNPTGKVQTSDVARMTEMYAVARANFPENLPMPKDLRTKYIRVQKLYAAIGALTAAEQRLFKRKYQQEMRDMDIWIDMGVSKTVFYTRRRLLVCKVAKILGLNENDNGSEKVG